MDRDDSPTFSGGGRGFGGGGTPVEWKNINFNSFKVPKFANLQEF